ncbi:MAG TPA: pentapeptide repeat-containing protein [Gaiellaceae bacterium]|nr:pentapeptide repeat-containing protein [Gaiellaceae bacterium]
MSKAPRSPYPPDLPDDPVAVTTFEDLADAEAKGQDWANVRQPRFSAHRVVLRECRLTGAELAEAAMTDVSFIACRLDLAGLRFARFQRVAFSDCQMAECDLYGAVFKDVLFERCDLQEATFSSASFENVEFAGCDLAGLRGAEALRGVRMAWNDVLQSAPVFATALGIEILD